MSTTALLLSAAVWAVPAAAYSSSGGLYHADPRHPWNRAHIALCARAGPDGEVLGLDSPFPLLWGSSTYLLEDARFAEASGALEELVATADETSGMDARARVLMQSDLWAVFDWAAVDAGGSAVELERRRALALGAARAMRALAPKASDITSLSDPLRAACASGTLPAQPMPASPHTAFLPPDLGPAAPSPWVLLSEERASWEVPLAAAHAEAFQGRTSFAAYLRLPAGRAATLAYLDELGARIGVLGCDGSCGQAEAGRHAHLDPEAPAPPEGTLVALVQRLMAFDDRGELFATPIPLVVQLRAFLPIPADAPAVDARPPFPEAWPYQAFAELRLDRRRFLAGAADSLAALGSTDRAFGLFAAHGDEVELLRAFGRESAPAVACTACHGIRGALSLNVYTRTATGSGTQLETPLSLPPRVLVEQTVEAHALRARRFKARRFEWGVLRGIWAAAD